MARASQSERQLGDRLSGKELVDAEAEFFAAEAREFGEQRRRVDLDDELAGAAADDLAVRRQLFTEQLVERFGVGAPGLARAGLLEDVAQEVGCWPRLGHEADGSRHAPLMGMTT
jgi:hypothetical protein